MSPAEAANDADILMTCVGKDEDLKELAKGLADSKKWISKMPFHRG